MSLVQEHLLIQHHGSDTFCLVHKIDVGAIRRISEQHYEFLATKIVHMSTSNVVVGK